MNNVLSLPIRNVAKRVAAKEIRPTDLAKAALNLAESIKPLNAFITITKDLAESQASALEENPKKDETSRALEGIPIAIKDNFCTSGQPTTCASKMLANFVPHYDATVYKKLIDAGAVLIGKTNLDQFAMGSGTIDSHFGPSKNLFGSEVMKYYTFEDYFNDQETILDDFVGDDDWYIAGGSSGGSAISVASGACFAALGSDSGGSVRNPASLCGVVGLKPTYGSVSRHGLIPLVNSMDVPGILARNVDDALLIFNTIAGPDAMDSTTVKTPFKPVDISYPLDLSGLRIGIPREYKCPELSNEVEDCWMEVGELLRDAGAHVFPVSVPHTKYSIVCYSVLNQCEVASNMARYDGIEYGHRAEVDGSLEELIAKTRSEGFNDVVRGRILAGNYFLLSENYDDYFVKAMKVRRLIAKDFDDVWSSGADILLTPTTLNTALKFKDFRAQDNRKQCSVQDYCTQPVNMAGLPALSLPIKLSKNGLPLSIQLIAPKFYEQRIFAVAKWIEDVVKYPKLVLRDDSLLK